MSKRKKQQAKQKAKEQRAIARQSRSSQREQFAQVGMQVFSLIEDEKPLEALDLITPLLEQYPRSVEVQTLAGMVFSQLGNPWGTIEAFEYVQKQSPDPLLWAMLRDAYLTVDMPIYAMQAARRALRVAIEPEEQAEMQGTIDDVEQLVALVAQKCGISLSQAETGLRHQDEGHRALENGEYQACIDASRRAIRFLGNWPPAHNNLAEALFFQGHPADALTTTQNVLAQEPDNLYALSNAIKFLAWSGKVEEARPLWEHLRGIEPQTDLERIIIAEAAAILEEDESVYQLLKPVAESKALADPMRMIQSIFRLAIAEANLKRVQSAIERIEFVQEEPHFGRVYEALKANRPGLGYATRYSYFSISEILPTNGFEAMMKLMDEYQSMDEQQFISRRARHNERYPQSVLAAKMLLWEEMQIRAGIVWLAALGTPESYALMREFGLSKAGKDQERIDALLALLYEQAIDPNERLTLWLDGEWQEKTLTEIEAEQEDEGVFEWSGSPEIKELATKADEAFVRDDFAEAERLFKQVLTLEPKAYPYYYNLAIIYNLQGQIEQAKAMLNKALEINPDYAYARLILAVTLLESEGIDEARKALSPITDVGRLDDNEASMFMFVQARILVQEGELEEAAEKLTDLLDANPEFEPAIDLLETVEQLVDMQMVEKEVDDKETSKSSLFQRFQQQLKK